MIASIFIRSASRPGERMGGFTLIELLVVIAIIAFLAALVAGLGGGINQKKVQATATTLLEGLQVGIESYKSTYGFYPPDNPEDPSRPPLYYHLKGTLDLDGDGIPDRDQRLRDGGPVDPDELKAVFEDNQDDFRVINSGADWSQVTDFLKNLKDNFVGQEGEVRYIAFPYKGPNASSSINPVHYDASSSDRHNPESYDLWIEVVYGGKTNVIGNWRQ